MSAQSPPPPHSNSTICATHWFQIFESAGGGSTPRGAGHILEDVCSQCVRLRRRVRGPGPCSERRRGGGWSHGEPCRRLSFYRCFKIIIFSHFPLFFLIEVSYVRVCTAFLSWTECAMVPHIGDRHPKTQIQTEEEGRPFPSGVKEEIQIRNRNNGGEQIPEK